MLVQQALQSGQRKLNSTIGLAFDGGSDHLIAVDEVVTSSMVTRLYIIGKYLSEKKDSGSNTIVTTVMSNLEPARP